jgi:hypothetical protein
VDFDADGQDDVISGSYHPGDLYLFARQSDGTYKKPEKILGSDGKPVNVGAAAHACAADWDADGDLDLIVGNIGGEVWLVPNEGSRKQPAYGAKQKLSAGGKPITGGHDAGPTVADWDGDGKPDLIVGGGNGDVQFYRNTSDDKAKPELAAAQTLVPESPTRKRDSGVAEAAALRHGMRVKPHVVDWNGDGKLDLLVGDFTSVEVKPELTDDQRARQTATEKKLGELKAEQDRLGVAPDGETPEQRKERQKQLRNVQREIITHSREALQASQPRRHETHGYVWLYLRKDAGQKSAAAQGGGG